MRDPFGIGRACRATLGVWLRHPAFARLTAMHGQNWRRALGMADRWDRVAARTLQRLASAAACGPRTHSRTGDYVREKQAAGPDRPARPTAR